MDEKSVILEQDIEILSYICKLRTRLIVNADLHIETEWYEPARMFHGFCPHIMGTRLDMLVTDMNKELSERIWKDCVECAAAMEKSLNRFDPSSAVSAVNRGEVPLNHAGALLEEAVRLCDSYKERTGGLFDIRYGGCLDFGGFAKGWFLHKVRNILLEGDVRNAFVDFGQSSILALGGHPLGGPWKVALTDPFTGTVLEEVELRDISLSTSGNSPGYAGHIVNPQTGEGNMARGLTTVLAQDPLEAEVLSTAFVIADDAQRDALKIEFRDAVMEYHTM